ncbi:MAG: type II secretion system GspH family protein [Lachnospiraceae bacterium]|nr:type II secretion system GspH family protein [Lachnospiraceae bacterium]
MELIVVLVILAILAAILVPALLGWIDKADHAQDIVDARALMNAVQAQMTEEYGLRCKSFSGFDDSAKEYDDVFMKLIRSYPQYTGEIKTKVSLSSMILSITAGKRVHATV